MWAVPRAPRRALGASELGAVTGGAETVVGVSSPGPLTRGARLPRVLVMGQQSPQT